MMNSRYGIVFVLLLTITALYTLLRLYYPLLFFGLGYEIFLGVTLTTGLLVWVIDEKNHNE